MSTKYEITRRSFVILTLFCLLLIGTNAYLLKQNFELRKVKRNDSSISFNTPIFPLKGTDFKENKVEIKTESNKKTILFVFSSNCQFCHKNMPNWVKITNFKDQPNTRIIGVSLGENGAKFIESYEFNHFFPIVNLSPEDVDVNPPFDITPQTILVNSDGNVEKVWSGMLNEKSLSEIIAEL